MLSKIHLVPQREFAHGIFFSPNSILYDFQGPGDLQDGSLPSLTVLRSAQITSLFVFVFNSRRRFYFARQRHVGLHTMKCIVKQRYTTMFSENVSWKLLRPKTRCFVASLTLFSIRREKQKSGVASFRSVLFIAFQPQRREEGSARGDVPLR